MQNRRTGRLRIRGGRSTIQEPIVLSADFAVRSGEQVLHGTICTKNLAAHIQDADIVRQGIETLLPFHSGRVQFLLETPLLGEVTNKPDEQGHGSVLNPGDRNSDGEFTAITANSQRLHREVILASSRLVFWKRPKRPDEVVA